MIKNGQKTKILKRKNVKPVKMQKCENAKKKLKTDKAQKCENGQNAKM